MVYCFRTVNVLYVKQNACFMNISYSSTFTFSHLEDTFVQSDLQIRTKLKRVIVKRSYKVPAFLRVA